MKEQETDPVLASIERARAAPPMSEKERRLCLALAAEVTSDPSDWLTTEQFMAEVEAVRLRAGAAGRR